MVHQTWNPRFLTCAGYETSSTELGYITSVVASLGNEVGLCAQKDLVISMRYHVTMSTIISPLLQPFLVAQLVQQLRYQSLITWLLYGGLAVAFSIKRKLQLDYFASPNMFRSHHFCLRHPKKAILLYHFSKLDLSEEART